MIVVIDNYDSFTYNIVQALQTLGEDVRVFRNDSITLEELDALEMEGLVISPGPGGPPSAGISVEAIKHFQDRLPILGICLGHQCIGQAYGAKVVPAKKIMHGKTSAIEHDRKGIFTAIESPFNATRYHSLALEWDKRNDEMEICARAGDGEIMGIMHRTKHIYGIQFHPESIMSDFGTRIFENYLSIVKGKRKPERFFVNLKEAISRVVAGRDLSAEEMGEAMNMIMSGESTPPQISSFLTALSMKGETPEEIAAAARVMRKKAIRIGTGEGDILDTCGTGGDRSGTFNVSTTVAFVAAGAGARVAKHGNRSVTSKAGSADVLEELGTDLESSIESVEKSLREDGITFMFAPKFHLAMKHAAHPRREIGIKTIFNILGPLSNPAGANRQVIGVYSEELGETYSKVLKELGSTRGLVVHGTDGLDEVSISDTTIVWEVGEGTIEKYLFDPRSLGFDYIDMEGIKGGDAKRNGEILLSVLDGEEGAALNMALINSAFAIYCAGLAADLKDGIEGARESIFSGRAREKLEKFLHHLGNK